MSEKPFQVRPATVAKNSGHPHCIHCGKSATKEVLFERGGIVVVEKYCDACLDPKTFEGLQDWYAKVAKTVNR